MPPPKGTAKVTTAPRLPPLTKLRVRRPNKTDANPCVGIMSSVLGARTAFSSFSQSTAGISKSERADAQF